MFHLFLFSLETLGEHNYSRHFTHMSALIVRNFRSAVYPFAGLHFIRAQNLGNEYLNIYASVLKNIYQKHKCVLLHAYNPNHIDIPLESFRVYV